MEPTTRIYIGKYYDIEAKYFQAWEIGRGQYGVIYLCVDRETHELTACKSIVKKEGGENMKDVLHELAILQHLPEHPNIVCLKGAYDDSKAVHIVMDFCEGGELFKRIVKRGPYMEREAAVLMRTIMDVVKTCHTHGVMHRDLKLENLLFANENEDSPLKAIDFGLAAFFTKGQRFSELSGTPMYMAPEMWMRDYGPEVDIWSAGVILYVLLSGRYPFQMGTPESIAKQALFSRVDLVTHPWPTVSTLAKALLQRMLDRDPKARITTQQVLYHPWIQINAYKHPWM